MIAAQKKLRQTPMSRFEQRKHGFRIAAQLLRWRPQLSSAVHELLKCFFLFELLHLHF